MGSPSPASSVAPIIPSLDAAGVARGVTRMLLRHDHVALAEVPLANGRRADLMAIDSRGAIVIVEIKVSRADLLGDAKWTEYLDHCDRFYWAVPHGFDAGPLDDAVFLPERSGVIVADRYDAVIRREASDERLGAPARRKAILAFARRAGRRLIGLTDPDADAGVRPYR